MLLYSLFAMFATSLALAGPIPRGTAKADYYPLKVGHVWVYVEPNDILTVEVTKIEEVNGKREATLTYKNEKGRPNFPERTIGIGEKDFTSLRAGNTVAEIAAVFAKRSLREGDTWETVHKWTNGELVMNYKYKVGEAKVIETPAGKFTALPVVSESSVFKPQTNWYANGVGLVRREENGVIILDLKSFTQKK